MNAVRPVREAQVSDIAVIQGIARETWAETYEGVIPPEVQELALASWYATDSIKSQLNANRGTFLVAEDPAGACIGFAQFVRHPDGLGELTRIYVLPSRHGEGFGFHLLQAGLSWLRGQGVRTLVVAVEEQNPSGRRFYERNGFTEHRTQTDEMFGHELATVVYRRAVE